MQIGRIQNAETPAVKPVWFLLFASLAMLVLMQACIPKLVPIQTARITQVEFYRQWYELKDDKQAKQVIEMLIGRKNWVILERRYAYGDVTRDLIAQKIEVQGAFTFTISLVPTDLDSFYVEGIGRYFLVRKTTNEIILSSDFYIKNHRYALKDLNVNRLPVKIKQYTIRHFAPDSANYYHDALIEFNVHLKTISAEKAIYSIDYDTKHEVLWDKNIIGYLEFDESTPRSHKLIDLRGINLVKDDYLKILERSRR
jgi:hypothetical protein